MTQLAFAASPVRKGTAHRGDKGKDMSKRTALVLLVLLGLVGCGDDLGWGKVSEATDADCFAHDTNNPDPDSDTAPQGDTVGAGDSELVDSLGDGDSDDGDVGGLQPDAQAEVEEPDAATDVMGDAVTLPAECTDDDSCDDGKYCTDDACEDGKCVHDDSLLDGVPCETDTSICTFEKCLEGDCLGAGEMFCDDDNPCTDDVCDGVEGCEFWANIANCTDGNACTVGDVCVSKLCVAGPIANCDDKNPCTDDACDPTKGCLHQNNTALCDDTVGCTAGDQCKDGLCLPGDPTPCDDGNPCTDDVCDLLSDCQNLPNDLTCTDGNACTSGDVCSLGVCGGVVLNCEDGNACTDDGCDPATGCKNEPNVNGCDDDNPCTQQDACEGGTCIGGIAAACNDQNDCTVDVCNPSIGCTATDAPAGTPCAQGYCLNGTCSCKAFGCAAPQFVYSGDVVAGMLGGMGGGVGPKMGCAPTDVLIGIGFDFSESNKTVTRTTVVCGKVEADTNGTVKTTQTTTQKSGGSGCYGWDPAPSTPLAMCPSGWVIVGIGGKNAPSTLFHSVSVTCAKMDVGGKPSGITQTTPIPATNAGGGTPTSVMCPAGTVARYFETRAGCGQDALTLYCAKASPDCTGQPPICTE